MSEGREAFHARHLEQARIQAAGLFARKAEFQGAWLSWVAAQLYECRPAEYAAMVRRELQQLQTQSQP